MKRSPGHTVQTSVRFTEAEAEAVIQLLENGMYSSMAEIIRDGVRQIRRIHGLM